MTNTTDLTTVAGKDDQNNADTISLLDVIAQTDDGDTGATLDVIRIGTDANFISLFTQDVVPVPAHYLEATDNWAGTYARCLGDKCPACQAGLNKTNYLLLPVLDRLEGAVKVLRITHQKGPGKLLTELGQVLAMPDRDRLVVRITRNRNYVHQLAIESETDLDPDLAAVVGTFIEKVEQGTLDISSVIPLFSVEDMATHEKIAKRLTLVRGS